MCPNVCDPTDCSLPGSSVHGILQARILQWVPMSSSRGSSQPRDRTRVSCLLHWQTGSLPLVPPRKPQTFTSLIYLNGKLIHTHTHTHTHTQIKLHWGLWVEFPRVWCSLIIFIKNLHCKFTYWISLKQWGNYVSYKIISCLDN